MTSSEPPHTAQPVPPVPPRPSGPPTRPGVIASTGSAPDEVPNKHQLVVRQHLLWVAGAAFPLNNIARVHTYVLHPRRGAAAGRFFRRLLLTGVVMLVLVFLSEATRSSFSSDDTEAWITLAWMGAAGFVIWEAVHLLTVLTAPSRHVLGVDTSGAAAALVSFDDPERLQHLLAELTYALEHPGTEFTARIETLNVDLRYYQGSGNNYQFHSGTGDNSVVSGNQALGGR
ncbi:DUF6232 family protein [Streptomyces sp. NPDC001941]|uniref:DUF6232 family protein n=1 Tax=Streptomyces sp. NPDC001941 TaxID=3154659 RepID=UPI003321E98A